MSHGAFWPRLLGKGCPGESVSTTWVISAFHKWTMAAVGVPTNPRTPKWHQKTFRIHQLPGVDCPNSPHTRIQKFPEAVGPSLARQWLTHKGSREGNPNEVEGTGKAGVWVSLGKEKPDPVAHPFAGFSETGFAQPWSPAKTSVSLPSALHLQGLFTP